jgi:quinol monooxygenase YgiN
MLAITAIIRVKKGCETAMREALIEVVRSVRANEPATVSYYISQGATDPRVFTTYERYLDRAAMDRHKQFGSRGSLLRHSQAHDRRRSDASHRRGSFLEVQRLGDDEFIRSRGVSSRLPRSPPTSARSFCAAPWPLAGLVQKRPVQ